VLPILFGDRLVGRIEPRLDRASKSLRILGISWERGFHPRSTEGLVPALRAALEAYMSFIGATSIHWHPNVAGAARLIGRPRPAR